VLRPDVRERLARVFRAPVRDFYGSRECASIAAECEHGRLHVQGHAKVVEIVDARGEPAPPATAGRVLVTDLANRAFGLIRYATGDVASRPADDTPCACGSPYPSLERVHGRTSDFLTAASGERIHGEWFTHLFYGRDDVEAFQVHQLDRHRVRVRTVGPADAEALAKILDAMRHRLGETVDVAWERVTEIAPTVSGKWRFTISDVPTAETKT
jgi:phenylacetate-CoA ligase